MVMPDGGASVLSGEREKLCAAVKVSPLPDYAFDAEGPGSAGDDTE